MKSDVLTTESGFIMQGSKVQRPPIYNAEDYAEYLYKYCKFTGLQLYLNTGMDTGPGKRENKALEKFEKAEKNHLMKEHQEMGLKQFSSISELLSKLKEDLHLSYHSFIK